jgi:hypothetical protein
LDRWPTSLTGHLPVVCHASRSGTRAAGSEIGGDFVTAAKVHLVGRLTREGCVREDGIVLFDVGAYHSGATDVTGTSLTADGVLAMDKRNSG